MTIKQLFATEATERKKKERKNERGRGKKARGSCENANESCYAPKLLLRDALVGHTHTPGGPCTAVMHICRQVGLLIMQRSSDPAGDPNLLAFNYVPQGN